MMTLFHIPWLCMKSCMVDLAGLVVLITDDTLDGELPRDELLTVKSKGACWPCKGLRKGSCVGNEEAKVRDAVLSNGLDAPNKFG